MRNMTMVIVISLATGCNAAKSAVGLLSPKQPNITVVNEIKVEPAPVQVNVQPAPVVAAVAPAPAPVSQDAPRKSRLGSLKAAASGAVAGAVVGGVVGYAFSGKTGAGKGAALGAGAGAIGGTVAHQAQ